MHERASESHKIAPVEPSETPHEHNPQMYPDLMQKHTCDSGNPITSCNPSQSIHNPYNIIIPSKEITEKNDDPEHIEKHEITEDNELPMDPKLTSKIPYKKLYMAYPTQFSSLGSRMHQFTSLGFPFSCYGAHTGA